jgi:subtilisin family serine protease
MTSLTSHGAYWDKVLKRFGVHEYHAAGILGQNTSMYIIDTGINQTESDLLNVKVRSFSGARSKNVHGSAVTSIIKTVIAPKTQVYLADLDTSSGVIYTSSLVSAIRDAVSMNVDIITISLGTNKYDTNLQDAVNEAYRSGILVFAAAGNCACPDYEFPAACEHAISVGSINADTLQPSTFNTRNDVSVLFAPGENVQVPIRNGQFKTVSGTSFSAPFVAGLAALVLSQKRSALPGVRLERNDMVELLRDKDHLGLSCNVHNYTRVGSCAGVAVVPVEQSWTVSYTYAIVIFLIALALGIFAAMSFQKIKKSPRWQQMSPRALSA